MQDCDLKLLSRVKAVAATFETDGRSLGVKTLRLGSCLLDRV